MRPDWRSNGLRSLEGSAARSPPVDAQYQSDAPLVQTVSIDVPVTAASPSTRESNRKLVDLDDDDGHAPDAAMKQNTERAEEPIVKITDAEGMVGLSEQPALVSVLPENETDIAAVDRALPVLVANPQITGNTRDIQALPEADARLLLDIPAESQAVALHGSTSSPRRSTPLDDQSVTAFIPLDGRSPKRKAIRSPDASPTHPASDLVLPRQSFSAYDAGASPSQIQTTRIPSPLRSELDERDVTTVDQVRPQTTRIPFPLRSELDERDVTTDGDQIRRQTPSPIRNRTTLREEIMSSAGKRRRALERPAHKGDRHSPDKVYVSTSIPATQPTPEPIAMKGQQLRSSSPALSPAQRKDRILAGEKLVHGVKEQYRTRISGLSEKYNVKPTDLFKLVNEMPKRDGAGGQVYWMDVEERLRIHYGY